MKIKHANVCMSACVYVDIFITKCKDDLDKT